MVHAKKPGCDDYALALRAADQLNGKTA